MSDSIANIDTQYASNPSPGLYEDRQLLQTEYDILSTEEAEKNILCAQRWVYEQSDKTGRLLVHQIRQAEASRMIPQIRLQTGIITVNHKEINSQFK